MTIEIFTTDCLATTTLESDGISLLATYRLDVINARQYLACNQDALFFLPFHRRKQLHEQNSIHPSMLDALSSEVDVHSRTFFDSPSSKRSLGGDSTSWQLPLGAGVRSPRTTFYPCRLGRVSGHSHKMLRQAIR